MEIPGQVAAQPVQVPVLGIGLGIGVFRHLPFRHAADHLDDVFPEVLALQGEQAAVVHGLALLIHDVVVFEHVLPHVEMLGLHPLLGPFDGSGHHGVLDHFSVRYLQSVHDRGDALGAEEPHQVVLEREVEPRRTRVPLASGTSAELAVDAPGFVAFGSDDVEAAEIDYAGAELDVGAPARHVRSDGHRTGLARLRDDLGFLLVELGVQHVVLDPPALQHAAQRFRGVDGGGPDQDGLALFV